MRKVLNLVIAFIGILWSIFPEIAASQTIAGFWSFNEGSGATVTDATSNGNNGSIHNASWTSGRYDKSALLFNGSNSYIEIPDHSSLNIAGRITIQAWVFPTNVTKGEMCFVDKYEQSGYSLGMNYDSNINKEACFLVNIAGAKKTLRSKTKLENNQWYHVGGTYDGSIMKLFINGIEESSLTISGSIKMNGIPLLIGAASNPNPSNYSYYFKGVIDEVLISATRDGICVVRPNGGEKWERGKTYEIYWSTGGLGGNLKVVLMKGIYPNIYDYKTITSSTPNTGSYRWTIPNNYDIYDNYRIYIESLENPSMYEHSDAVWSIIESSNQNLIGYWPFNDGSGTSAKDMSVNKLNGNISGCSWATDGNALAFDGINDRVVIPNNSLINFSTESFTLEAWIKTNQNSYGSIIRNHVSFGYNLSIQNGRAIFSIDAGSPGAISVQSTSFVNDNKWHHVMSIRDRSEGKIKIFVDGFLQGQLNDAIGNISSPADLWIGGKPNGEYYFNGLIDEVKISNGVQNLPPTNAVLLCYFNDGNGTVAKDLSGNNLNGGINGPAWTTDGNALKFDGVNDRVTIPQNQAFNFSTGSFTIEAWIKTTQSSYGSVIRNHISTGFHLSIQNGLAMFGIDAGSPGGINVLSSSSINNGKWHHVKGIRDRSEGKIKIYVDGIMEGQLSDTVGDISSPSDLWIGAKPNGEYFFNGLIDEAKIWNTTLYPTTVKTIRSEIELPSNIVLSQNYPNPFNPETKIEFVLLQPSSATLQIFNLQGQSVVTLVNQRLDAGSHIVNWNGSDQNGSRLPSGTYYYRLSCGNIVLTRKMTLIR